MRREAGRVVAQPAQVDDLGDAGALGLAGHDLRRLPVALLEVGRVQRVHQVVNDLRRFQDAPHRRWVTGVGDRPVRPLALCRPRPTRHRDDLVLAVEGRQQHASDGAAGAEDHDPHRPALPIRRLKYRRLMARWMRRCTWL